MSGKVAHLVGLTSGALSGYAALDLARRLAPRVSNDEGLEPPKYPWSHVGLFSSYDHASVRRGYQVYKEVCAACHSLKLSFRHLVGVSHTEAEAKAEAAEADVTDGPDDTGAMFTRSGKLMDRLPAPYPNEEAARAANGGALPPDLTLMTKARHDGQNYVFSLITGYSDPPEGVVVKGTLHYNKYFPGGAIAMAQSLYDDVVEYADGTPATTAQMAKDVTTFLCWAAEPEMEERKLLGIKGLILTAGLIGFTWYYKRYKWSLLKSSRFVYRRPNEK